MKILHISKYYSPYIGGVENICKYCVEGSDVHDTAVVCFKEGKENKEDYVNGHKVYRVGTLCNIARQALSLSYYKTLKKAIEEFRPDIIHFHWANPYPALVLLLLIPKEVKLVIHWHMDVIKQKFLYFFVKPIEKALLKRADIVLVTSPQYRDGSIPLQPFKDKVFILPNAFDEQNLQLKEGDANRISEIKKQYGNKPIVFFVGRHIEYKGLPYLLDCERLVKGDCVFLIGGNGPLTDKLKNKYKSDRIHFVGRLTDDDLRCYHYAADIFAFPSITKNEAFGVALAEALYTETPAVTFTIPGSGVNWVNLNGKTGIEVPNRNIEAYASAIDTLLSNPSLCKEYGQAGKKHVLELFTISKMSDKLNSYYEKLF